jgi:hypothetical protein
MQPRNTPLSTPFPELKRKIDALDRRVVESDAGNHSLYQHLEQNASLADVTIFMNWDGEQPPFNRYLRNWLRKSPPCILDALTDHIREEEEEHHAELFKEMLAHLNSLTPVQVQFDARVLDALNYTFSARCAEDHEVAFFVGGFLATEIMSARRCAQIRMALVRLGVDPGKFAYLRLHADNDIRHGQEVKERFVLPLLESDPGAYDAVCEGVDDRLRRSAAYLSWYGCHILGSSPAL